jgi:hypothetical protein
MPAVRQQFDLAVLLLDLPRKVLDHFVLQPDLLGLLANYITQNVKRLLGDGVMLLGLFLSRGVCACGIAWLFPCLFLGDLYMYFLRKAARIYHPLFAKLSGHLSTHQLAFAESLDYRVGRNFQTFGSLFHRQPAGYS